MRKLASFLMFIAMLLVGGIAEAAWQETKVRCGVTNGSDCQSLQELDPSLSATRCPPRLRGIPRFCEVERISCDDGNPDTYDIFDKDTRTCVHLPKSCPQPCDTLVCATPMCVNTPGYIAVSGCVECAHPSDCDDGNTCTRDDCDPLGHCFHDPVADYSPCGNDGLCSAGECVCEGADCECDDGDPNTRDVLEPIGPDGEPVCVWYPLTGCTVGAQTYAIGKGFCGHTADFPQPKTLNGNHFVCEPDGMGGYHMVLEPVCGWGNICDGGVCRMVVGCTNNAECGGGTLVGWCEFSTRNEWVWASYQISGFCQTSGLCSSYILGVTYCTPNPTGYGINACACAAANGSP